MEIDDAKEHIKKEQEKAAKEEARKGKHEEEELARLERKRLCEEKRQAHELALAEKTLL